MGRKEVEDWWKEADNLPEGAVIIQSRVHDQDLPGQIHAAEGGLVDHKDQQWTNTEGKAPQAWDAFKPTVKEVQILDIRDKILIFTVPEKTNLTSAQLEKLYEQLREKIPQVEYGYREILVLGNGIRIQAVIDGGKRTFPCTECGERPALPNHVECAECIAKFGVTPGRSAD